MSEASTEGRGADPISDYLAIMTGTAPAETTAETDVARVRDGILDLTDSNASSKKTRKLDRADTRVRVLRTAGWIGVVLALVWIAGNVVGYFTAEQYERPVVAGESVMAPASVRLPGDVAEGADCFGQNAGATVWKAPPPASLVLPYRCGDSIAAAVVPGPISIGAWVLAFVCAILLVELRRRRKVSWY
jgi:hypothetical protein